MSLTVYLILADSPVTRLQIHKNKQFWANTS